MSLREFEAGIAAPDHDQMRRQVIELQSLDMRERSCGLEAGNARNRCVGPDVEEDFVARQRARPAVIQAHLERLRRHKAPASHDQLGAARLIVLQMRSDQRFDHFALALTHLCHVDLEGPAIVPNCAPWRARCATSALRTTFLLGRQAMLGQEPPIHLRSTTAVRRPDPAMCQASSLPPAPLPKSERHIVRVETWASSARNSHT